MKKQRLDQILVIQNLVESRSIAQRLIMAGQVRVNGQVQYKSSTKFQEDVEINIDHGPKFVSRGGEKLEGALQAFKLDKLEGLVCADIGASTGGFTDCLLQYGAKKVYAVDVGYGLLHWNLRNHSDVVSMEKTNARYLESFPEPIDLITIDASFIPLSLLLPLAKKWFGRPQGKIIALIKPQFEAGKREAARGKGVIRDPMIHRRIVKEILQFSGDLGYGIKGFVRSSLKGPKGNVEFLVYLETPLNSSVDINNLLDEEFGKLGDEDSD